MKRLIPFAVLLWLGGCLHGCSSTSWRVGIDGELMGQHFRLEASVAVVVGDEVVEERE